MMRDDFNDEPGKATATDTIQLEGAVAIVGMSGRFPKAKSIDALWQNLLDKRNCATRFALDELEDSFDEETRSSPNFVSARPILDDVELFDADFFAMYPREAALTDPQQRVFLECAWEAIEDAGYDPSRYAGSIGVFAGASLNTYLLKSVLGDREAIEDFTSDYQLGSYPVLIGNLPDIIATRVAYKLNLRGPAMSLGSACSTSALAVVQACQSLLFFQSDMAIAGGVSITLPQRRGYLYQDGGMGARDGLCRPYDAGAAGTIFGSGAGAVLLKRAEDAVADGDHIYALIRGFSSNNDGSAKVGFTAPSVDGQAECIIAAHAMGGIDPATVGYVEGHGTATPLGDPIEFAALRSAFAAGTSDTGFCALGSSKANIGHLDAAAGVAGVIKAALCLDRETIPPLTNFSQPNPNFELDGSPFYFNTETVPWPRADMPRRAGVSSFGVGGTNVHIVLEEAPAAAARAGAGPPGGLHVLPLSARTEPALGEAANRLAERVAALDERDLGAVAFTLQAGRKPFEVRHCVVAANRDEAAEKLRRAHVAASGNRRAASPASGVAFLFPGQGAQYPGMGRQIYETERVFRDAMDRGAEILEPLVGGNLVELLYGDVPSGEDEPHPIRSTILAQPALFLVEHALARLWMSFGVTPSSMIGHSVGEFTAACLAGVFSFEDGLKLIAARGRLMQQQPGGAMLAVRAGEADVVPLLGGDVEIAAINAPRLLVVAGPFDAIEAFEKRLEAAEIAGRRLHTSHAFHSAMMDPVVSELERIVSGVRLAAPSLPYISCVTGTWITDAEATDPNYWARHCRATVRFTDGLSALCGGSPPLLLEVGPGRTLATFAAQSAGGDGSRRKAVTSLPEFADAGEDRRHFLEAVGRLWSEHHDIDWSHVGETDRRRVSLPTYPFERKRHWIDPPAPIARQDRAGQAHDAVALSRAFSMAEPPSFEQAMTSPPVSSLDTTAASATALPAAPAIDSPATGSPSMTDRKSEFESCIFAILERLSGAEIEGRDAGASFIELGFDSLFLGQLATEIKKTWKVKLAFRQLMREFPTPAAVAEMLCERVPFEASKEMPAARPSLGGQSAGAQSLGEHCAAPVAGQPEAAAAAPPPAVAPAAAAYSNDNPASAIEGIVRQQLATMQQLMSEQLDILRGAPVRPVAAPSATPSAGVVAGPLTAPSAAPPGAAVRPATGRSADPADEAPRPSRFDAYKGVKKARDAREITPAQRAFIDDLVARYTARTPSSKRLTQARRRVLADPRTANGFRQEWKEMVYPIVSDRSKGSRIWDIDGNDYVDLVNGFGPIAFGHSPDFVIEAIAEQLSKGIAIGPQSPLAGEVAELFCEVTGNERVTFCNTGSEAVMAAMRLSRAVTGRNKIVTFAGDYHGQFDEVIIHGRPASATPGAVPAASGIPAEAAANMVVLPYGEPESLDYIRAHADDIAGVLVETLQSRRPDFLPVDFIRELRVITEKSEAALIFDEVVTGFRVHPGGMQARLGIRADLATYGKVVGGGMPVGALGGKALFMDALDGGYWQYGDDSVPEVAPTFFAGTFVRHPLALAAMKAVLQHIRANGSALYDRLDATAESLRGEVNNAFEQRGLAALAKGGLSSFYYLDLSGEGQFASLFYHLMRLRGVHMLEGFASFLTTEHSDADIARIVEATHHSLDELQAVGMMVGSGHFAGNPPVGGEPVRRDGSSGGSDRRPPLPIEQVVPLTEVQREVWMAAQLGDAASCAFNESCSLRLVGEVDADKLRAALDDVVVRHDALRASFGATGERMRIAPEATVEMPIRDLGGEADPDAALAAIVAAEAVTPFQLDTGPVARAVLCRMSPSGITPEVWVLVFTAHHIVCDGWSLNIVMSELSECYAARLRGTPPDLPEPMSYVAYSRREAERGDAAAEVEAFWLKQFETIPELPDRPADRARPARKSFRGSTVTGHVAGDLLAKVRAAGAAQGCTLFSTLFAAFQVLAGRLADHNDVVVAVPTAGQSLVDDGDALVGHCVNFLPLRQPFDWQDRFSDHLQRVKQHVLDAFDHQDTTFGTLVRKLALKRDMNRLPLTELQFNLEKIAPGLSFAKCQASLRVNPKAYSNFDIFFNVIETGDGLQIDCDYNTDIFDPASIERLIGQYTTLLEAFVADPDCRIARLPLLSQSERDWLLDDLNRTARDISPGDVVHRLVERQAQATPGRTAIEFEGRAMSFADIDAAANRLARYLRQSLPDPGARIAVAVERSPEMLVVLLAVLKAGHTYVPLDPSHPAARLRSILEAADVAGLVCNGAVADDIAPPGARCFDLDRDAAAISAADAGPLSGVSVDGEDVAYVIFTSGSTGTPKGVAVPHRAVVNFLRSMAREPGFTADDTIVAVTTVSFDIAVLELFLPLVTGGRIVLASREDVTGGFGLVDRLTSSGATVLQATPSLWRILLEAKFQPAPGMKLLCGGEPLPRDLADALIAAGGELWNMYGPTETTVWSTKGRVAPGPGPISIGAPIDNTQIYILDDRDEPRPVNVPGHLYIGGDGLALGYFGRDDLTAAAFRDITLPGHPPRRLYRTGDLAVRRADGSIEHLGRVDHQVKLRGFRIELGDIEAAMRKVPGVKDAAAALRLAKSGDPCLVGYIVAEPGRDVPVESVATALGEELPDYMVPTRWQTLAALPMTANAKLDRKALPEIAAASVPARPAVGGARTAPATALEATLFETWKDVLSDADIGTRDSLFALGADSLQVFRIAARLADRGLPVKAKHLLEHPTIAELAAFIATQPDEPTANRRPVASLKDFRHGARRGQQAKGGPLAG